MFSNFNQEQVNPAPVDPAPVDPAPEEPLLVEPLPLIQRVEDEEEKEEPLD